MVVLAVGSAAQPGEAARRAGPLQSGGSRTRPAAPRWLAARCGTTGGGVAATGRAGNAAGGVLEVTGGDQGWWRRADECCSGGPPLAGGLRFKGGTVATLQ